MKYLVILLALTSPLAGNASELNSYLSVRDSSMSSQDKQESGIRFLQLAKSQGLMPLNETKCLESFAGAETGPKGPSANSGGAGTGGGTGDLNGGNDPCGLNQSGFKLALQINERSGGSTGGGGGTN